MLTPPLGINHSPQHNHVLQHLSLPANDNVRSPLVSLFFITNSSMINKATICSNVISSDSITREEMNSVLHAS
jgi:hypothetical protein